MDEAAGRRDAPSMADITNERTGRHPSGAGRRINLGATARPGLTMLLSTTAVPNAGPEAAIIRSCRIWRSTVALALVAIGGTLVACGDEERDLTDQDTAELVERVLTDLDLPGSPEAPPQHAEVPDGELEFGFHCHIEAAGLHIDDELVAFPSPLVGHDERPGGEIERVEVSLLAFDSPRSASAVLSAYDLDETTACLSSTFSEQVRIEVDDPLEAGDLTADGFKISIGGGEVQVDGHRTFAAVVGRILVDVTVLAPDEGRGRELAAETVAQVVEALEAGGA